MVCLSDIKQLNETVAMTSEARAKEIDPPMKTTQRGLIGDLDASAGGLTMVQDMDSSITSTRLIVRNRLWMAGKRSLRSSIRI